MKNKISVFGAAAVALVWLALAAFAWFGPRTDISEAERRKLEQFPQLSVQAILDGRFMSRFETFTQDQFPLRDSFRQLKSIFSYKFLHRGDNNGIYIADGSAAKLEYPLNEASVQKAAEKFDRLHELYLSEGMGKILFCVVPDKGYYLAAQNGYPAMDYDALFAAFSELGWGESVDIRGTLSAESYYTTDTHWRQEKLLPTAEKLAAALDIELPTFTAEAISKPFYGVYYGQAALPMEPDTLYVMRSEVLDGCTVTNHENNSTGPVYDPKAEESRDLYDIFLYGPKAVLTVENPAAGTDRELIVFRDSFGSSLVPLLIPGYAKVTLLDIRYIPTEYLSRFVEFGGQDVLFLYSPLVLNNSALLK